MREGCDESQGFLHSRPVPKADFERLLDFSGRVEEDGSELRGAKSSGH
jgi:EAL domain-containing protein (putative c-di-GMP-specific phosphodiesterase class I)